MDLDASKHVDENSDKGAMSRFLALLHNIIPTLDRIKSSIEDTTGKMPQLSNQLGSVATA